MIILILSLLALGALLTWVEEHIWLNEAWEEKLFHVLPDLDHV